MKNAKKHLLVFTLIQIHCVQAEMEGHVIGGEEVDIMQYPHAAFLDARCDASGQWICGSTILNQRILLTAAHCVEGCNWKNSDEGKLITFVGNADLREVVIKRKIISVRIHEGYDTETLENDIAVAKVRKGFPLGPNVQRVIITKEFPYKSWQGFVAGWGLVRADIEISSMTLKHVRQRLRSVYTCAVIGHLHKGMFCAGSRGKIMDHPAKGDSGSALVTVSGYHQIGVVSFCVRRYPALMVYTNVSYYYDWIVSNARSIYCE